MRDKELSEWTCQGIKSASFFVATIDDEVVGTVGYKIKVRKQNRIKNNHITFAVFHNIQDKEMEIFRLSTDHRFRKHGVASKLMNKIDSCASILECENIIAETACCQYGAVKFYTKKGWTR